MTSEKPHPITLEQVLFVRSVVVAIPNHQPSESPAIASPVNQIDVTPIAEEPGHYSASMRTIINQESDVASPYFIDMECMAILIADDSLTPEEALRGITITAHSVLYGAIREAVAWLTARQPYGTLALGLSVLRPVAKDAAPATQPAT